MRRDEEGVGWGWRDAERVEWEWREERDKSKGGENEA